ncbi:uncharacterized protein DS421_12g360400 [Arachis hypogaea]|nr:uncharacterized protein DS421_12g360400 [Arachis hypogaea]
MLKPEIKKPALDCQTGRELAGRTELGIATLTPHNGAAHTPSHHPRARPSSHHQRAHSLTSVQPPDCSHRHRKLELRSHRCHRAATVSALEAPSPGSPPASVAQICSTGLLCSRLLDFFVLGI